MPTIREALQKRLEANGLFPDEAGEVMALVVECEAAEAMRGRWGEDTEAYPPIMLDMLWLTTKRVAAEWIAENKPQAWYRPMFDEDYAKEIGLSL